MSEVLVCANSHIDGLVIQTGFSAWNRWLFHPLALSWMGRDEAEESKTHRQLIPYCVFRYGDRLFSYRRKGGEERLDGMKSLGVGGHIEPVDLWRNDSMYQAYRRGVEREVREEVKVYDDDMDYFHLLLRDPHGIVRDDSTGVGRVHLGLVHVIDVTQPHVTPRETGITEAGFRTMDEIEADLSAYECWSVLAFNALKGGAK